MVNRIEKIKKLRLFILKQISGLSVQQLNTIPDGYNNNIIWNIAHLTAALQSLCYIRSGLPVTVEDQYFSPFLPGTKPEGFIEEDEVETIKKLFITCVEQLQADFIQHKFAHYSPSGFILKIYGVEVNTIDDAIDFLIYHEGFHIGCIFSFKHLV